jgi:hypothetical protein
MFYMMTPWLLIGCGDFDYELSPFSLPGLEIYLPTLGRLHVEFISGVNMLHQ